MECLELLISYLSVMIHQVSFHEIFFFIFFQTVKSSEHFFLLFPLIRTFTKLKGKWVTNKDEGKIKKDRANLQVSFLLSFPNEINYKNNLFLNCRYVCLVLCKCIYDSSFFFSFFLKLGKPTWNPVWGKLLNAISNPWRNLK